MFTKLGISVYEEILRFFVVHVCDTASLLILLHYANSRKREEHSRSTIAPSTDNKSGFMASLLTALGATAEQERKWESSADNAAYYRVYIINKVFVNKK
jgi:hypothetical protein